MKSKSKTNLITRRNFLHRTALAAVAVRSIPSLKALGYKLPNEKLNLAAIGAGGQPFSDLRNAHAGVENVVALADVDWSRGAAGFAAFPKAAKHDENSASASGSGDAGLGFVVRRRGLATVHRGRR